MEGFSSPSPIEMAHSGERLLFEPQNREPLTEQRAVGRVASVAPLCLPFVQMGRNPVAMRDAGGVFFFEKEDFVMAITAAKGMVWHVARRELICTGELRCVRPLRLPLPSLPL